MVAAALALKTRLSRLARRVFPRNEVRGLCGPPRSLRAAMLHVGVENIPGPSRPAVNASARFAHEKRKQRICARVSQVRYRWVLAHEAPVTEADPKIVAQD
jgi:hypothetical protein